MSSVDTSEDEITQEEREILRVPSKKAQRKARQKKAKPEPKPEVEPEVKPEPKPKRKYTRKGARKESSLRKKALVSEDKIDSTPSQIPEPIKESVPSQPEPPTGARNESSPTDKFSELYKEMQQMKEQGFNQVKSMAEELKTLKAQMGQTSQYDSLKNEVNDLRNKLTIRTPVPSLQDNDLFKRMWNK